MPGLGELLGVKEPSAVTRDFLRAWVPVLFGGEPVGARVTAPPMRPECEEIVRRGRPIGPRGEIVAPAQDIPFVLYPAQRIPLQFVELPPES